MSSGSSSILIWGTTFTGVLGGLEEKKKKKKGNSKYNRSPLPSAKCLCVVQKSSGSFFVLFKYLSPPSVLKINTLKMG